MYNKVNWPLTLYFDGECPLCAREIKLLRGHAVKDRLLFDGRWVTGLDATLWSWRAAGLGFWATPLTWRALRPLLEFGYRLFCRLRPHLAWLPHPDSGSRCVDNRCRVPASKPASDEQSTLKKKQT